MTFKKLTAGLLATLIVAGLSAMPVAAEAQQHGRKDPHNRNQQQQKQRLKNERNNARNRAEYWRHQANKRPVIVKKPVVKRPVIVKRPVVVNRRPVVVQRRPVVVQRPRVIQRPRVVVQRPTTVYYRPQVIYRTVPQTSFRYNQGPNPRWYPTTPPNEWRNIATISGGVALLGLLTNDRTLTFAGTLGSLYSLNRYDQDRRSRVPANRLRAAYFSRPYFYREGRRFDRVTVYQGGHKYYRFVRR